MVCSDVNSGMDNRERFERAYREARYEVDLPSGPLAFRIGDGIGELRGRPFALITAYNPGERRPTPEENAAANAELRQCLADGRRDFLTGRGTSLDGRHIEPSFAVFGVSREEALRLAGEFRQAAIVWFDGAVAELAWTDKAAEAADT